MALRHFTFIGAIALTGVLATAVPVQAQTSNTSSAEVRVGGGAHPKQVWISILGGSSSYFHRLYYFPDPFDPITGVFSPLNGSFIAPATPSSHNGSWSAGANETYLGTFDPGTELVFGLLVNQSQWFYSGNAARNAGLTRLFNFGSSPVYFDEGVVMPGTGIPSASGSTYGFEDLSDGDYNDFVFKTREASVTPEPASMVLLGTGLAGVVGAVRRRRKQKAE